MQKKFLSFIIVVILIVGSFKGTVIKADGEQFEVSLKYGYGTRIEKGKVAPFEITIKNNGDNFEGSVQILLFRSNEENIMFEKKVSLAAGQEKTVVITVDTEGISNISKLRILNNKDKVVFSKQENLNFATDANTVNIGVLSDDFSAFGYVAGNEFKRAENLITDVIELDEVTLQEDALALEMLDVILVSDYSTDRLSDKQLDAVFEWVDQGGLLLIGTGSTASKTLSKLNGNYTDIDIGQLDKYKTKFGLSFMDFSYYYAMTGNKSHPIQTFADELADLHRITDWQDYTKEVEAGDYQAFFDVFYLKNEFLLKTKFWSYCFGNGDYDAFLKNSTDEELKVMSEKFKEYCYNEVLKEYYPDYLVDSITKDYEEIERMQYVEADILDFSMADAKVLLKGEISGSDESFELVEALSSGEGYIAVAGFDFASNPFASYYGGNGFVVTDILERLIGGALYEETVAYEANRYYDGYNNQTKKMGEKLATFGAIPLLLYMLFISIYVIAGIVLYKVLKKKDKSVFLWPAQTGLSLVMTFVVFAAGFATRITEPKLDVARVNFIKNDVYVEDNIVTVTMPEIKSEQFSFSDEYGYEYLSETSYRYNYTIDAPDSDYYKVGYLDEAGMTGIELVSDMPMELSYMKLTKKGTTDDVEINAAYFDKVLKGSITNNYGTDLENAFIYTGDRIYYLGDIKQGETISLTDPPLGFVRYSKESNAEELLDIVFFEAAGNGVSFLLLGSMDKEFREYYNRMALLEYCFEEYIKPRVYTYTKTGMRYVYTVKEGEEELSPEEIFKKALEVNGGMRVTYEEHSGISFVAFPAVTEERTVQALQKYDENTTEILVKVIEY